MENIEIVVGTYENLILGYKFVRKLNGSYSLEASFTEDFHTGPLKCLNVSASGVLVSSSTDDCVRLQSLVKRRVIGQLFQHSGPVNSITFYKRSHMFTASEDGTICMWKVKKWEMIRTLKGHKAHVIAVAVHPSGKLGLSVGSDRSLLTWDFVTGKLAFHRKITEAAQNILFTFDGNHYILVYQKKVEICDLSDTKTVQEITTAWRINSVCMLENDILAIGGDDRYILVVNIFTGERLLTLDLARSQEDGFSSRVRSICSVICDGQHLLITAAANGNVKVFQINLTQKTADTVLFYEARVRMTCMAVVDLSTCSKIEEDQPEVRKSVSEARDTSAPAADGESHDSDEPVSVIVTSRQGRSKKKSLGSGGDQARPPPFKKSKLIEESSHPVNRKRKEQTANIKTENCSEKVRKSSTSVPNSSAAKLPKLQKKKKMKRHQP